MEEEEGAVEEMEEEMVVVVVVEEEEEEEVVVADQEGFWSLAVCRVGLREDQARRGRHRDRRGGASRPSPRGVVVEEVVVVVEVVVGVEGGTLCRVMPVCMRCRTD